MDFINEGDGELDQPEGWGKKPTRLTSVNVNGTLWEDAKRSGIKIKDALEFGIKFLIEDNNKRPDYPPCNLLNKIQKIMETLTQKCEECDDLRDKLGEKVTQPIDEVDEVFNREISK